MRVAVIGAGPAGMTAALQLCRGGAEVSVFEASKYIGGLARTFDLWGQRVDLGPHRFFSTDRRVNQLWLDLVGDQYAMVHRLTRLYYQDRFFHYPLRPINTLWNMGPVEATRCLASYLRAQWSSSSSASAADSFESWIVQRFGRRLFEMFFKSYSEKLWGIPCDEISSEFAAQRIKKFSLQEAVWSMLFSRYQKRHETLLERFAYPLDGTGSVYEKMADQIRETGGQIHLQSPVKRIIHDEFEVQGIELTSGRQEQFDHVISTMPLTTLVCGLSGIPAEVETAIQGLQFRNTLLVYLHVETDSLFDDQWLYIHAPELKMGRVTNFRNWVPQLHGKQQTTILAVEYWCNGKDAEWTGSDASLIEQATHELRAAKLLKNETILNGHVERLSRSYPIYRNGFREKVDRITDYLRNFCGLTPIGRYGAFKYVNQEHSILMGILAAEKLLENKPHDLWNVNTDYETYQEETRITETGLVG